MFLALSVSGKLDLKLNLSTSHFHDYCCEESCDYACSTTLNYTDYYHFVIRISEYEGTLRAISIIICW